MTIDDTTFEDSMRRVMHEEVPEIVRGIIHSEIPQMVSEVVQAEVPPMISNAIQSEVPPLISDAIRSEVPPLIRAETADMRQDIADIKDILGDHGMRLNQVQREVSHLTEAVRRQARETHRLDVLLEDLNDRFATARELRWD